LKPAKATGIAPAAKQVVNLFATAATKAARSYLKNIKLKNQELLISVDAAIAATASPVTETTKSCNHSIQLKLLNNRKPSPNSGEGFFFAGTKLSAATKAKK